MLSLRNRFGIPGVISVLALVFALAGGAYAANGSDGGATASAKKNAKKKKKSKGVSVKQVRKIAKQEARKFANSNPGPAGPVGLPGAAGPKGDKGSKGDKGDTGDTGKEGKEGPEGEPGLPGLPGAEGSPWTAGGVLPEGETETGAWSIGKVPAGGAPSVPFGYVTTSLSFPIPLASGLDENHVHFIDDEGEEVLNFETEETQASTDCLGSAEEPTAAAGHLCVYTGTNFPFGAAESDNGRIVAPDGSGVGTAVSGAVLEVEVEEGALAYGTWAVTAEE